MTRSIPTLTLAIAFSGAACGPAPITPRATPQPIADAGASPDTHAPPPPAGTEDASLAPTDAGAPADADAGGKRQKLPAPDAGAATAEDAGADAQTIETGAEDGAPAARPPAAGEVVVVEVLANPGGTDTGREWIEIANRAPETLALADLHLADTAVDVAVPAGAIAPGERIVLGQSADPTQNGGAPVTIAYGTRLALNNDGEEISLCIGPCADGVVVDRVAWKTLGAAYDGHALVFDRDADRICAATQPFGTAGDFGTPGGADNGCAAPDGGF